MTVSDIISTEDIRDWDTEEIVIIQAGTGKGKSYFIKNVLYQYAKERGYKILYLVHRRNLLDQFKTELERDNKLDTIDLRTYQSVEAYFIKNAEYTDKQNRLDLLLNYDYIICDEFHYFCGDSKFNNQTDISFKNLFLCKNAIKICMSATPDEMFQIMAAVAKRYGMRYKKYKIEADYSKMYDLIFYDDKEMHQKILSNVLDGEKAIVFCDAKEAYNLHLQFPDSLFLCSSNNTNYYKYVDTDAVSKMLVEEKFTTKFLFTTTCLDAGVNLRDFAIKTIIVDVGDIGSLIQCVGRKRIIENVAVQGCDDYYNLYIHRHDNKQINGWRTNLQKKIEEADLFYREPLEHYKKYGRNDNRNSIIYFNKKGEGKINWLRYYKTQYDINLFTAMIDDYEQFGYCRYLATVFGKSYYDRNGNIKYKYHIENQHTQELYLKLLEMSGGMRTDTVYMYKKSDKIPLIQAIGLKDKKGQYVMNREKLNAYLWECGLDYQIQKIRIGNCTAVWYVKEEAKPKPPAPPKIMTDEEVNSLGLYNIRIV